jgi:hypothetical protein
VKPLVTFALFGSNQEEFMADAVAGALAQTYSPLRLIFSDDCSTDGTFGIMKSAAARYGGPHQIVLNRNKSNLGFAGHVNCVSRLVRGGLMVVAAGDDISLPCRTATLVEAWESSGRTAGLIHSRVSHINQAGEEIRHPHFHDPSEPTGHFTEQRVTPSSYVDTLKPPIFGCSEAFSLSLAEVFGDLPTDLTHEDNVLMLRALLVGGVLYVDRPVVKYRMHGSNSYNAEQRIAATWESIKAEEERTRRNFAMRAVMHRVFCGDLTTAYNKGMIGKEEFLKARAIGEHHERLNSLLEHFMACDILRRPWTLLQVARAGAPAARVRKLLLRLLPAPAWQAAKLLRGRLHYGLWPGRPRHAAHRLL